MTQGRNFRINKADGEEPVFAHVPLTLKTTNLALQSQKNCCLG